MPLIAYGFQPIEFIVTPQTTYMLIDWVEHTRRIYTDGRDWPQNIELCPSHSDPVERPVSPGMRERPANSNRRRGEVR
jgi:hypothetical protein